jgi:phosphoenolpyruvate synthase/pyruvate phosphate dikinase
MSLIVPDFKVESDYKKYGGKAAGLFLFKKHGFRVPDFYLIDNTTISLST